ncbi:3-methyl-2-oxobutanoate hydroxymethyltransferase [Parvularcula sp. ZS-1/3]|uniref:3-methyl-2-oxobutanoate hydroxymethyltransferase n=1 Tax=Parvularcula mediterranea TaxID=2732508 RepID=A0A7Y3RN88_9PROT|nr:3-methyl-2-oxobutanoate hydroxymethyltransferase [Parvularcula mediterranea]NNU17191.1 3-methyl-2-oxobutanoate hydroxymethyltransferase [Parvularcula mediterranea]
MSAQRERKAETAASIRLRKGGEPIVCLTAYDAPTAKALDSHCDLLLVGDSLGMVVHGMDSTVGVTLEMMILHGQAVMRGADKALVVVDLPFGSYEISKEQAFDSARRVVAETGCGAVKVESGIYAADSIAFMAERGIPVMAHVGLRPQAQLVTGGFKAKGKTDSERDMIIAEARAADEAGAFAMVIEGTDEALSAEISKMVSCPTIGIGASASCDGQILVTPDMMGMFAWTPKFVRRYADMAGVIDEAAAAYARDVRARTFPGEKETYRLKKS